jgi:hypothetical protein
MNKHAEAQLDATRRELAEPRLPRYSRASFSSVQSVELLEQTYTLQDSKGRTSIWMHVKSRAKDKKSWPLFCERDTIHGTIEVDFDIIDSAKAVSIAVRRPPLSFFSCSSALHPSGSLSSLFPFPLC